MKVTVRIKCPQHRTLERNLEEADFEIKGPFYTGNMVTLLASITGKIVGTLSKQYIEVEVTPSDYSKCQEKGFQPIF